MSKRRGVVADPEIVKLAEYVAGVVAAVLRGIDKVDLLERPRPTDDLRAGRFIMIAIMHHHYCFNEQTGEVARRGPATTGKNWREISQQRIAAALKRDRGVISDAAHAMDEACNVDFDIAFSLNAIADAMAPIIECGDAWADALQKRRLDEALSKALLRDDDAGDEIEEAPKVIAHRCHACLGKGHVRIHMLGRDKRYMDAWQAAQRAAPAADGFHELVCVTCNGSGQRTIESRRGPST